MSDIKFTREELLRRCGLLESDTSLDRPITGLQLIGAIHAMQLGFTATGVRQAIEAMAPAAVEPVEAAQGNAARKVRV